MLASGLATSGDSGIVEHLQGSCRTRVKDNTEERALIREGLSPGNCRLRLSPDLIPSLAVGRRQPGC